MTQPGKSPPARARRARPLTRGRFSELPAWVQAVTAVVGVILAAIGVVFTGIQVFGEKGPTPSAVVIRPEAFIERVTIDAGQVSANGEFRNVDLAAEVILFVGRQDSATNGPWLPVEASAKATASAAGARVDGAWDALRPMTEEGRFTWLVLVVPAGSGAADGYRDIRERGPDSDGVLAASAPFQTGR